MNTTEMIWGYLKSLLRKWYVVVFAFLDFVGLLAILATNIKIPIWLILTIFCVVFLYANFEIYRDNRHEIRLLKENYEKKIFGLIEKIKSLEYLRPKLDLFFSQNGNLHKKINIEVCHAPDEPDYEELVLRESEELYRIYNSSIKRSDQSITLSEISKLASMEVLKAQEDYKKECDEYLSRYKQYLRNSYLEQIYSARYRQLDIALKNTGNMPGKDVIIVLDFPDQFHFLSDKEYEELEFYRDYKTSPKRPSATKSIFNGASIIPGFTTFSSMNSLPNISQNRGVRGPFIKPKNSSEISFEVDNIMHDFTEEDFDSISLIASDELIDNVWEIPFTIHASNLPEPEKGFLIIEVQMCNEK